MFLIKRDLISQGKRLKTANYSCRAPCLVAEETEGKTQTQDAADNKNRVPAALLREAQPTAVKPEVKPEHPPIPASTQRTVNSFGSPLSQESSGSSHQHRVLEQQRHAADVLRVDNVNSAAVTNAGEAVCREAMVSVTWNDQFHQPDHVKFPGPKGRDYRDKLACQMKQDRPLVNHNFHITPDLERLEGIYGDAMADQWRKFAYRKVVGLLKKHPRPIRTRREAEEFARAHHGIGDKMVAKIVEIIETGKCRRRVEMEANPQVKALEDMTKVHGLGGKTAKRWYDLGCRNLEDVLKNPSIKLTATQTVGLRFKDDFQKRIPRSEVTVIADIVKAKIARLWPGAISEPCGSYRRGKPSSGDCDILISHPDLTDARCQREPNLAANFLNELRRQLRREEFITCSLSPPGDDALIKPTSHAGATWSGSCYIPDGHAAHSGIHRRLDLKVYPASHFPFAIMYFTGSDHFNRSMRHYAKKQGWTLSDHGLCPAVRAAGVRIHKGKSVFCRNEEAIFDAMGLRFIPPTERSCYEQWVAAGPGDAGKAALTLEAAAAADEKDSKLASKAEQSGGRASFDTYVEGFGPDVHKFYSETAHAKAEEGFGEVLHKQEVQQRGESVEYGEFAGKGGSRSPSPRPPSNIPELERG